MTRSAPPVQHRTQGVLPDAHRSSRSSGNALRDAPRHNSVPRPMFRIGRRA
ncbi:DUF1534 domain-containing protein [Pseudomonas syringae]|nr:DUF1534 domain-containing protein [Pseudomonas syringae]MCF5206677.1 DUF1534 domain-containing protein [Pseudomonas syringae]MCF5211970.1 DUF1534 domain-containing protein [Pseudomonas syringae]MCF5217401.1 DUF1534 domain-containing protein [Pseudomonas syringae]MCF5264180.1 DUF1534 domain-containing protein [Pseudomonas syringae]